MSPTAAAAPAAPMATPTIDIVPLADLYPSPSNPRKHFDGLDELALSLTRKGVEMPLLVRTRPTSQGQYEVVDGERRYRAATQAGIQFLPIIRRDALTDAEVLELQLENAMQRSELTPLEEARGIRALLKSAKQTPAEIAKNLSRSERFVADRLRLLDLVPELQQLLDQGRITVAHADVLSKLTAADQQRALDPGGDGTRTGGLWDYITKSLDFDIQEVDDRKARKTDPFFGLKVATVKELEAWIARAVRFDVDRMAETAPLEFGRVKGQVETAAARAVKVIHITHDHHLSDAVKDPGQRVYGPRSWKRADGTVASVRVEGTGRFVDAKTCEHAVLGLVTVGPEYGRAFEVCIARDTCTTHWGTEIREKKKRAKLLADGQGAKVAKHDQTQRQKQAEREAREKKAREVLNATYRAAFPSMFEAIVAAVPKAETPEGLRLLWDCEDFGKFPPEVTSVDTLLVALVRQLAEQHRPHAKPSAYESYEWRLERLEKLAKAVGVNLKPLMAAATPHEAAAATGTKAAPAKKAARR